MTVRRFCLSSWYHLGDRRFRLGLAIKTVGAREAPPVTYTLRGISTSFRNGIFQVGKWLLQNFSQGFTGLKVGFPSAWDKDHFIGFRIPRFGFRLGLFDLDHAKVPQLYPNFRICLYHQLTHGGNHGMNPRLTAINRFSHIFSNPARYIFLG